MGRSAARTADGYSANEMKNLCVAELDRIGATAWVNNSRQLPVGKRVIRFGKKGSSDVIGFLPNNGRFVGMEVKTKHDVVSVDQQEFGYRLKASGGYFYVIESEDDLRGAVAEICKRERIAA